MALHHTEVSLYQRLLGSSYIKGIDESLSEWDLVFLWCTVNDSIKVILNYKSWSESLHPISEVNKGYLGQEGWGGLRLNETTSPHRTEFE